MTKFSYEDYPGDGSTDTFSIPFSYLNEADIQVEVDGNPVSFTFLDSSTVKLDVTPTSEEDVRVFRRTAAAQRVVNFNDASTFTGPDINNSFDQALFVAQEAFDVVDEANEFGALALTTAISADETSIEALNVANQSIADADQAATDSAAALSTAQTAEDNASNALTTAQAADQKADDAVEMANEAKDIAEAALGVGNLSSDIIDNESVILGSNITEALDNLVGDIVSMSDNNDSRFDNIEGDVGTLQGDVGTLQTDLDNLNAFEIDYDDSVTDFGLAPEDLNVQKAIEAVAQQAASITVTQSEVRQTVNTGPVDSDGRADFLEAGSGLQVVTKGVDGSTPLNITFGNGFDTDGKRDVVVVTDGALSWDNLPNNTDDISLFLRLSGGTVTTFHEVLAPVYGGARPSSPSEGQTWYPTDHRGRMEIYESGAWNDDDLIICVGECSTDNGSVVDVRSYAYQGIYKSDKLQSSNSASIVSSHNIGTSKVEARHYYIFRSPSQDFSVGDIIDISTYAVNMFSPWYEGVNIVGLAVRSNDMRDVVSKTGGGASGINNNNFDHQVVVRRAF